MVSNIGVAYAHKAGRQFFLAVLRSKRCSTQSFFLVPIESWEHTFFVNSRGTFLCHMRAEIQIIIQGRGGKDHRGLRSRSPRQVTLFRILSVFTDIITIAVWPTSTAYGASAAAVHRLTQNSGITCVYYLL